MTRDRDLLALLHEVDARLAAATPSPRLAARLGAQLRGERPSLARRVGRPLALALAAGTAAVGFGAALQRPATPEVSARIPAVEPAIGLVGDRSREDGGIPERTPTEGHPPAPPRIYAPLLREPPRRLAPPPKTSPPAPHSSAAPPEARDAPEGQRSSELPEGRTLAPPSRARAQPPAAVLPSSPGWVDALERAPLHASRGPLPAWSRGSGGASAPVEVAGQKGERSAESSAEEADGAATGAPREKPTGPQEEAVCRTAEDLTSEVEAMCDVQGLLVGDVKLLDRCRDGGYRGVEHTCVDGEPTECWRGRLGDGLTCDESGDLKDQAYITCSNQGADLTEFTYDRGVPGCGPSETTGAVYACCPAAEPLPSRLCWTTKIDHGDVCQAQSTLGEEASAMCADAGQRIFRIWYNSGTAICPEAHDTSALFTCCP
ncbi:hypothetical protein WME95_14175 [Sorangium sp. So ce327]|jgi:hypothetical protein|uniref:hypothetical protein n=1 Tax=Sorangium sp. So ce327 TaxID=3133301 RepID=UPI003F60B89C